MATCLRPPLANAADIRRRCGDECERQPFLFSSSFFLLVDEGEEGCVGRMRMS